MPRSAMAELCATPGVFLGGWGAALHVPTQSSETTAAVPSPANTSVAEAAGTTPSDRASAASRATSRRGVLDVIRQLQFARIEESGTVSAA
jgi:hypothetical protein